MTIEEAIERIRDHMVVRKIGQYPHIRLAEALKMAIAALHAQQEPNAPLTLEELREMDGKPVWVVPLMEGTRPEYALVDVNNEWLATSDTDYWDFDVYGRGVLACRHKLEEGAT